MLFEQKRKMNPVGQNILEKRYFWEGETEWRHLVKRVCDDNLDTKFTDSEKSDIYDMILNTYFIPNSPCLVNSGKSNGGKLACFVVDFNDSTEEIFKTKLNFAQIARKGGGCGTTLSKIRPKGSAVKGSAHGYAGGPIAFADTISHDMEAFSQGGFRSMALMFTQNITHPDILEFITAKSEEGKISNANLSVVVTDDFMRKVINDETYWTEFDGVKYKEYRARDVFNQVAEGAWRNGEPGILFYDRMNDSPYKYSHQEIMATNPCLHPDTLIETVNGRVPIKDITEGTSVYSYGEDGKLCIKKCSASWVSKQNAKTIKLKLNNNGEICLTPDHKVMSKKRGWVEAKDLVIGEPVVTTYRKDKFSWLNFSSSEIISFEDSEDTDVYDITVEDTHNLIANYVVVHNCAEQSLPPNGCCNLGSFDVSKFITDGEMDWDKFRVAIKLAARFLDTIIDKTVYPNQEIEQWSKDCRPIGMGVMGFADYLLQKKIAYGSKESIDELKKILTFMYINAEEESIRLGNLYGIPKNCEVLPTPRRNITLLTVAPTGTISLFAGCSSGIEPIFSEITIRNDKTGSYTMENDLVNTDYFRCAVSSNGAKEVTWQEHIEILAAAQECVDSGVSKTVNCPTNTHRDTIAKMFIMAWEMGCKGLAVYRNGSRKVEVLSPKNIKKDKCPLCDSELFKFDGERKCSNPSCSFTMGENKNE